MKKTLMTTLVIVALAFLTVHAFENQMPGPDAAAFWTYITKTSPYTEWKSWDDFSGMQPSNSPHGAFVKVYVNDILFNADTTPVPYGSIQVKEGYNADKKLTALTVMYKVKDYNAAAGDWYWARFSTEGKGGPEGKVDMCIGCHKPKADNDYIFVHKIK
ncbi:MAG: cytochrome P460 family protein [Candidatus Aminicenantes bacterium]|nr:cytochrome P460 family protein [Candidatus Aminicenantes bacterium]